jgi:hypothetical protein
MEQLRQQVGPDQGLTRELRELGVERSHILFYVAARLAVAHVPLTRESVAVLADELSHDMDQPIPRTVRDILQSNPAFRTTNTVRRDPFLKRIAIVLEKWEVDKANNPNPPRNPIDSMAGSGPSRPLLKDLYSMVGIGNLVANLPNGRADSPNRDGETFYPTNRGLSLARSMQLGFPPPRTAAGAWAMVAGDGPIIIRII